MANGNEEKEKTVELKSIFCEIYPDWQGDRVGRDFRFGDKVHKFSVGLPVPKTDDEAQNLYGVGLAYFVKKGVLQHSYDSDTNLGNKFVEAVKAGTDPNTLPPIVSETLETDLIYTERERIIQPYQTVVIDLDLTLDPKTAGPWLEDLFNSLQLKM